MKHAVGVSLLVVGLTACVTAPPPREAHLEASSAIRAAAEVVKADKPMPQAELYLARARDHVRKGEALLQRNNYEGARLHFERAEADAETAISLARAHQAEQDAMRAEARLGESTEVEIDVDD